MNQPHRINFGILEKNSSGVYKIPLTELANLRFTEIPFYSTIEMDGLPGSVDTYGLEISATHGGGPSDEFFTLNFHVNFSVPGDADKIGE